MIVGCIKAHCQLMGETKLDLKRFVFVNFSSKLLGREVHDCDYWHVHHRFKSCPCLTLIFFPSLMFFVFLRVRIFFMLYHLHCHMKNCFDLMLAFLDWAVSVLYVYAILGFLVEFFYNKKCTGSLSKISLANKWDLVSKAEHFSM